MKLQPNFSWQKYEGKPENQKEQFQYQLQTQHILVANSINTTIDDLSFFTRERVTGFSWVNQQPIWTKTLATAAWGGGGTTNTIPLGITAANFTIIKIEGCISNGNLPTSNTLVLPNLDVALAANEISITRTGANIVLTSGGTNYSTYSGYITVYFVKT